MFSLPNNKCIFVIVMISMHHVFPVHAQAQSTRIQSPRLATTSPVQRLQSYGKLPLTFIRNNGQVNDKVQYLMRGNGHMVFFASDGVTYSFQSDQSSRNTTFKFFPVNANPSPKISGEGLQKTQFNYFRGADPKHWQHNVPAYGAIRYHDIYPGVDMTFHGNNQEFEYDIILQPGKNPDSIRLAYEGIESLALTPDGNLDINFKTGHLLQKRPVIYQEIAGKRIDVAGQFKIIDSHSTFGFTVASYDKNHPLIIDPALMYATFLGGTADDVGRNIAVDDEGNAYIVGITYSTDFPVTTDTFDMSYNGGFRDTFIAKLNASGSFLIYATYIGGNGSSGVEGDDFGDHITVDSQGNAYISGTTNSADFPTTAGAFDSTYNGATDGFIVKLDDTGSTLIYSSYLGSTEYDLTASIVVDTSGNLYVTGNTFSTNFPTTPGAYDRSFDASLGQAEAFITKINPSGTGLVYSTFLGGGDYDFGDGIAIDPSGNAYVTGHTASTNFPVTPDAADTTYNGGLTDTFVAKLSPDGAHLLYATYLGGSDGEQDDARTNIGLDAIGNIYVSGSTSSTDFPVTVGAFQTTVNNSMQHVFAAKYSAAGQVIYATYIAGTNVDAAYALAVDAAGDTYITGYTGSPDFPTTANAFDRTLNGPDGGFDLFITRLNSTGTALVYSSVMGGFNWESGNGVAIDGDGNAYITGISSSPNFPATPGAYTEFINIGGQFNQDAVVAKFYTSNSSLPPCAPLVFTATLEPQLTLVSLQHFENLHTDINTARARSGLGDFVWTTPAPDTAQPVLAQHLIDLRDNLSEELNQLGLPYRFTDANSSLAGTPIKAQHLNEIRQQIQTVCAY